MAKVIRMEIVEVLQEFAQSIGKPATKEEVADFVQEKIPGATAEDMWVMAVTEKNYGKIE